MIELDMVYVQTLETFLVKAVENLSNKIFCLSIVRQERPPGRQEKACRPGPHLKAAAKAGPARPLRNTAYACSLGIWELSANP